MSDTAGNRALLIAAMDGQGITDNELRAGIAAIVGGESGWVPHTETPYNHTANDRIRGIFRAALGGQGDAFIDDLKADPVRFFEYVYGRDHGPRSLGNTEAGDGYKFRGRGGPQLTGRGNYAKLAELTGLPLLDNPDLVNLPENSATITVAYMRWRYHGGGWTAIKAAVGNSFGNVDQHKNQLFEQYLRSGEFATGAAAPVAPAASKPKPPDEEEQVVDLTEDMAARIDAAAADFDKACRALQQALKDAQYYEGVVDGDWGPVSRDAMTDYRATE